MNRSFKILFAALSALLLEACSNGDPGPLAGSWKMVGMVPMTIQFRSGETEAMGIIEKVSYEIRGNDVIVKYESGLMKGSAIRYTMTNPNVARSELGILQRIK
jgi:hypothetical protein